MASTTRVSVVTASTPWPTNDRQREGAFGREVEVGRYALGGFGGHERGVDRDPGEHGQAQRGDGREDPHGRPAPRGGAGQQMDHPDHQPGQGEQHVGQDDGPGSRLATVLCSLTSFSMSQTATR
jgi:hypothetical protein